jgi:hypothetical protein
MKTVERIIYCLFRNGAGRRARRLVLEMEDGSNGGGWSRGPVMDLLVRELALYEELRQAACVFLQREVTEVDNRRMLKALLALDEAGEFGAFDDTTKESIRAALPWHGKRGALLGSCCEHDGPCPAETETHICVCACHEWPEEWGDCATFDDAV